MGPCHPISATYRPRPRVASYPLPGRFGLERGRPSVLGVSLRGCLAENARAARHNPPPNAAGRPRAAYDRRHPPMTRPGWTHLRRIRPHVHSRHNLRRSDAADLQAE
jgi:hypothetical protein